MPRFRVREWPNGRYTVERRILLWWCPVFEGIPTTTYFYGEDLAYTVFKQRADAEQYMEECIRWKELQK